MLNILFLCRSFGKNYSACGVCSYNLVSEFRKRGHRVWIISIGQDPLQNADIEGGYYFIKEDRLEFIIRKLQQQKFVFSAVLVFFIRIIRLFRALLFYPNTSRSKSKEVFNLANAIIKQNKIDIVVGTYTPFYTLEPAVRIKEIYGKKIKVVTYHYDPLILPDEGIKPVILFKEKRSLSKLKKECNVVDLVLKQRSTIGIFNSPVIRYVGLPLFIKNQCSNINSIHYDVIKISYVGTLDRENRNPSGLFDCLRQVYSMLSKKIEIHVWGQILDQETRRILNEYEVSYHGLADIDDVPMILSESNILINISNKLSYKAIPSKIFQLFASGRPIINYVFNAKDVSIQYFEDYKNVFNLFSTDKDDTTLFRLKDFIAEKAFSQSQDCAECFNYSDPVFICDLMEKTI